MDWPRVTPSVNYQLVNAGAAAPEPSCVWGSMGASAGPLSAAVEWTTHVLLGHFLLPLGALKMREWKMQEQ